MELFTATGKMQKFLFLTTRDVDILTRLWQQLEYRIDVCRVTRGTHRMSLVVKKKNFFSFPVAVNNSIKVGSLVFLL
jgi:hypothetical protein